MNKELKRIAQKARKGTLTEKDKETAEKKLAKGMGKNKDRTAIATAIETATKKQDPTTAINRFDNIVRDREQGGGGQARSRS